MIAGEVETFLREREAALAGHTVPAPRPELATLAAAHDAEARADPVGARARVAELRELDAPWRDVAKLVELRLALRTAAPNALGAIAAASEALARAADAAIAPRAWYLAALVHLRLRVFARAEIAVVRALASIDRAAAIRSWMLDAFGQILAASGAFEEARRVLARTIAQKAALGDTLGVAITSAHLAQLELDLGHDDEAAAHAMSALADSLLPIIRIRLLGLAVAARLGGAPSHDPRDQRERQRRIGGGPNAESGAPAELVSRLAALVDAFADSGETHPYAGAAALVLARAAVGTDEAARRLAIAERVYAAPEHLAAIEHARARLASTAAQRADHLERATAHLADGPPTATEIDLLLDEARAAYAARDTAAEDRTIDRATARATESNNPLWLGRVDAYVAARDPDRHREAILERFTGSPPEELARTIRTDASIIFADLVGFTPRSEQLAADEVMATVRCLFELGVPLLAEHRVQALSYRGDGLLACARGPGHEARALAFAEAFAARAARVSQVRILVGDDWGLDVRCGVAAGPVVLGVLGTLSKLEYVVNGYTANFAARLQGAAQPAEVVCDARVAASIGAPCTEALALKGIAQPVPVRRSHVGDPA